MIRYCTALVGVLLYASISYGQAPQAFNYQSIIRNSSGELVSNQEVGIQISILQGSASGTGVYVETHSPTTNANGLATLNIGEGIVETGVFGDIDWANGPYFVETSTDPDGGTNYSISSVSQLLSVPYAMQSLVADSLNGFDVPSVESKSRIIYGVVEANGTSPNAQGFSVTRLPLGPPGYTGPRYRYKIEFDEPFTEVPQCVVTNIFTEGAEGDNTSVYIGNVFSIVLAESDNDTIIILAYNPGVNPVPSKFSFIAIGQTE